MAFRRHIFLPFSPLFSTPHCLFHFSSPLLSMGWLGLCILSRYKHIENNRKVLPTLATRKINLLCCEKMEGKVRSSMSTAGGHVLCCEKMEGKVCSSHREYSKRPLTFVTLHVLKKIPSSE